MYILLILFCCLGRRAVAADDWWEDFAGNLATDLAPFISLFGDAPTKQFMSESLTVLDYIIFATVPLGVVAAVVSAIRVRGGSSLRAFIGRSQEGMGAIEAELCSSTSHDVCKLYKSGGGIARVMGRPKLLEIVHNPSAEDDEFFDAEEDYYHKKDTETNVRKGSAGLYSSQDYLLSTIIFAAIVTYYLKYKKDGSDVPAYGFPLMAAGTVTLCVGIYLCAFVVGESTEERKFRRKQVAPTSSAKESLPNFVWLQPGGQRIGDQSFDAFAYFDADAPLEEYTTSWKALNHTTDAFDRVSGFVAQFVGLRSLHSSISVMQLGALLVMSFIRSWLRARRMDASSNRLEGVSDYVQGHELDWLALDLARRDIDREDKNCAKSTNTEPPCGVQASVDIHPI
ncbi:uncharacterized protein EI97DRAFT_447446 [Westerdykella ornata]|uniref:Uncharacterized protein n=1 Tax=Westerdykella ornata TaxID=318751 RepID=A0A6A6JY00_WESOR|nr:uncharacterized protein EI97DRAFT_447446 [Westerdykella ornata]KAF2281482.1 hypothetical protein EI97DRAFT_447446 [Westerdykella ornata]